MAVASDSLYNARTQYISSHSYYGYVPPYRNESQANAVIEHTENSNTPVPKRCTYDTAMETDDYGCFVTSDCYNNDPMIPEEPTDNRLQISPKQEQCHQGMAWDVETLQRRNRKRCYDDLSPTSELKKFRGGGGNYHLHGGTGCTKDNGFAKVSYESDVLHINTTTDKNQEQTIMKNDNCCWAAGNNKCSLLNDTSCKKISLSNDYKLIENSIEYEKILFETHGCSIYHFHRSQMFDNDCTETEF